MKAAIIRYNAGNIQSVAYALDRLGIPWIITDQPEEIRAADRVIFPGVGQAHSTMEYLRTRKLDTVIRELQQPVLGICLGMQLMCRYSEEGDTECLGIFDEPVVQFRTDSGLKVPHMGWNSITCSGEWPSTASDQKHFYFVHSYYVPVNKFTTAICEYGIPFSAIMKKDNFFAVQFHPEKSAGAGEEILRQFFEIESRGL
jgi:glutamine amidotransferase